MLHSRAFYVIDGFFNEIRQLCLQRQKIRGTLEQGGGGVVSEMTVHKHGGPGSNSDFGSGNSAAPGSGGHHCRYSSQPSDLHLRPSAGHHD
jgi:hypothetical protein